MGSQCIVFSAGDDPYVYKICKANRYQPASFLQKNPFAFFLPAYLQEKKEKSKRRMQADFASYALAFAHLQKECGLVYLHLAKTNHLNATLHLVDPFKLCHKVESDQCLFYIQKKAIPLLEYLQKKSEGCILDITRKILSMTAYNSKLGIQLKDISPKNIGVCEENPIWIDPGRIVQDPLFSSESEQKKALLHIQKVLTPMLTLLSPNLADLFEKQVEEFIKNISSS
jgi:hypothetical protein